MDAFRALRDEVETLRETVRQLREVLIPERRGFYAGIQFSRSHAIVIQLLLNCPDRHFLSNEQILQRAGLTVDKPDAPGPRSVAVRICRINRILRDNNIPVRIVNEWGRGYYLTSDGKARLGAL